MIYLDNSATTFPKPDSVVREVMNATKFYSANPGRSGHRLSMIASQKIFECRKTVCDFFGIDDESKVVFTSGCTHSLNIVIKGMLKPGDHCVISTFEHNSVIRPLEKLKERNISYSIADVCTFDNDKTIDNFRKCINEKTKLVVCTNASNVFGLRLPVERICALCHSYDIPFCLDAAQSAGVFDIDIKRDKFDFVCCAGHKGLYGPMGIGILIINTDKLPDSIIEGGTGSESINFKQPLFTPDKYESGTMNVAGICGLKKGIELVKKKSTFVILNQEIAYIRLLYKLLQKNEKVILYTKLPTIEKFSPVLSFSVKGKSSEEVSAYLNENSIAVRGGLHCAPLAHKKMNTIDEGTVRVSPSIFTKEDDIRKLVYHINKY